MINLLIFTNSFDYTIAKWANDMFQSTNEILSPLLKLITNLGNMGFIFILISLIMIFFKKTRKIGVIVLFSISIGFVFTNLILKNVVARPRPFIDETSDYYLWWKEAGSMIENGYSFPSGHTTAAMAFGLSLFLCFKKKWSGVFLLIPLIMGFTRIYFMVHYTTDVLGAILVGGLSALISYFVIKYIVKVIESKDKTNYQKS